MNKKKIKKKISLRSLETNLRKFIEYLRKFQENLRKIKRTLSKNLWNKTKEILSKIRVNYLQKKFKRKTEENLQKN